MNLIYIYLYTSLNYNSGIFLSEDLKLDTYPKEKQSMKVASYIADM